MEGGGKDSKYLYKLQIELWLLQCRLLILIILSIVFLEVEICELELSELLKKDSGFVFSLKQSRDHPFNQ